MDLKNIIVHNLQKEVEFDAILELSEKSLPINDTTKEFAELVKDVYYKRRPNYGVFNSNKINYPFQVLLQNYLMDDMTFLLFTNESIKILENKINLKRATGGYVAFLHFKIPKGEFLAVLMLHNTKRYNINNELEIIQDLSLDIEKLDIANFINITKWNNKDETYLSFLGGRKEIRQYFTEFIGCTNQTTAKDASVKFKNALGKYLEEQGLNKDQISHLRNEVYCYCDKQIKSKETLSLEAISAIVNNEKPQSFMEFACGEDYQISSEFNGDRTTLKQLQFIKYRGNGLNIEFDIKLLDNQVVYNEEDNELIITNIPDELKNQILN